MRSKKVLLLALLYLFGYLYAAAIILFALLAFALWDLSVIKLWFGDWDQLYRALFAWMYLLISAFVIIEFITGNKAQAARGSV